jgi:protoporphyrinogen oxidase
MHVAIVGAGPAGLTAAYILCKKGIKVTIFEAHPNLVGGISRTESYKGYLFDIGGHRFFSKSKEIEDLWDEILENDFIIRPRKSRILYQGKFYSYPLKAFEALKNLGIINATQCVLSYAVSAINPVKNPKNFQDWVSNQFGKRLFNIFFKTYTEKVWGIPCNEISADWAAQRIKGLSLFSAIYNALFAKKSSGKNDEVIKTLIDSFKYPRKGPGMMWHKCLDKCVAMGATMHFNTPITSLQHLNNNWHLVSPNETFSGFSHVINTSPLQQLANSLQGIAPNAIDAAKKLAYRDYLTVVLIVKERDAFDDNWIYIHEPHVKVGRIQNYKSWSPEMVPEQNTTALGLEYFCFEGDGLWNTNNEDLITLGKQELLKLKLCQPGDVIDGHVVRQPKAYPVYDDNYKETVEEIKNGIAPYTTLQIAGRNGMHKYNNQDHSMMTAWLAAKNIIEGQINYDVWKVNEDAEYHEEVKTSEIKDGRMIPKKV